jgi:hypothetical protein
MFRFDMRTLNLMSDTYVILGNSTIGKDAANIVYMV